MRIITKALVFVGLIAVMASPAEATLTLRIERGIDTFTIVDNDGNDTDATVGVIGDVDMAAAFGGWAGGLDFIVSADALKWDGLPWDTANAASAARVGGLVGAPYGDGGRVAMSVDYDKTAGISESIIVSAAEVFNTLPVAGQPVNHFQSNILHRVDTQGFAPSGTPRLATAVSAFSTGPLPGSPLDISAANYKFTQSAIPTEFPPTGTPGTYENQVISDPGGTSGLQMAVGQTFTLLVNAGDSGMVSMSTLVNPEPVSLLLSTLGIGAVGFRLRRKKLTEAAAE